MKENYTVPDVNTSCRGRKSVWEYQCLPEEGVVLNADLPQSLRGPMVGQLEAYGALKLFILSSKGREGEGGGERRKRKGGGEEKEREGSKCRKRWRICGRVNCVYSAAMEKSILFFCLLVEICAHVSHCDAR